MADIVTRFAPSPTGYLHIGGARTALFNYLYTRKNRGQFYLRIEDTDRARSTEAAVTAILDGLKWLGIDHDGEVIYQFQRMNRHAQVAHDLVAGGQAYYCYTTTEELAAMRAQNLPYDRKWRDKPTSQAPAHQKPVIRIKMPLDGETIINDGVFGSITVQNKELDDMVLLRADGTPTYMLSVVVDDHDMGITHIIRGADHLTNSFRQYWVFRAMGWNIPEFAHIPLIHGSDGQKLSKRHGAMAVGDYRALGYLPQAVANYITRLGFSHGDEEYFTRAQAISWFDLKSIGQSPARFDFKKCENLNGRYIADSNDAELIPLIQALDSRLTHEILQPAIANLKKRAKTLVQLAEMAQFLLEPPQKANIDANLLKNYDEKEKLIALEILEQCTDWQHDTLYQSAKDFCTAKEYNLGKIANSARLAITGLQASPGFFELVGMLPRHEVISRIKNF